MADTFVARVAQAIGDPGSITTRQPVEPKDDGLPERTHETLTAWQTRAVLTVVSEHQWAPSSENDSGSPVLLAVLFGMYGLLLLAAGLWLGAVWL